MKLVEIYRCLGDETRLRLLNLLLSGPLCVCHLHGVLGEPQAKISKHLGYLKARGLVTAQREGNWIVYSLPPERGRSPELTANLACLRDCAAGGAVFRRDQAKLAKQDLSCSPLGATATRGKRARACC